MNSKLKVKRIRVQILLLVAVIKYTLMECNIYMYYKRFNFSNDIIIKLCERISRYAV